MAKIIFATGEVYEGESCSVYEAAKATFESVSREVLCALVNGEAKELSTLIEGEAEVKLLTFKDKEGKEFKIDADSVIMSVGYNPAPIAKNKGNVHVIGDAASVGNLRTVIWGAWDVAMKI